MGPGPIVPIGSEPAANPTFVIGYANILKKVEYDLTPESVAATSDQAYVALGLTDSPQGVGVNWLIRIDPSGRPLWEKELGCQSGAPGDYAFGVFVQQLSDESYLLAGGILGCGSFLPRALVEKLDSQGNPEWALAYSAGTANSALTQIRATGDGGYIAVGSATNTGGEPGALIFKLDSDGAVEWQQELGVTGSTHAYFNAVQQTADGGYIAIGEFYVAGSDIPPTGVLAVRFDSSGNIQWEQGFNNLDTHGLPSGYEHALSVTQTSDSGYLIAGNWNDSLIPNQGAAGALLLKLNSAGDLEWQKAYSGGIYCYFNDFSEVCTKISALAYSVHQTPDDGLVMAGLGDLELLDSVPLVPWQAKVDSTGNLLWQYFYYDINPATGRTLSEYFASATPANDGGFMALGFTWILGAPTGSGQECGYCHS